MFFNDSKPKILLGSQSRIAVTQSHHFFSNYRQLFPLLLQLGFYVSISYTLTHTQKNNGIPNHQFFFTYKSICFRRVAIPISLITPATYEPMNPALHSVDTPPINNRRFCSCRQKSSSSERNSRWAQGTRVCVHPSVRKSGVALDGALINLVTVYTPSFPPIVFQAAPASFVFFLRH